MPTCRSCPAEIIFVPSAKSGTPMILDPQPVADGNVLIRDGVTGKPVTGMRSADPVAVVISRTVQPEPGEARRKPHHASCPAAKAWRGRSRRNLPDREPSRRE